MLGDHLIDHVALLKAQAALKDVGLVNVLLSALAVVVTAVAVDYSRMLYLRSKLPPGPFPWPIIGNTFTLPENKPWIYFEELSKRFNTPLLTFWIGRYGRIQILPRLFT